ncbi:MAG: M3 family oligoendopeptidase [Candidatus Eremiobacteraeota bacterium]|nr:M3 family oligoendopeptidase [Candidatus Eremiobacteraeota bacterium]
MIALPPRLDVPTPTPASLSEIYDHLEAPFERASTREEILAAVALWDAQRRKLETWRNLVSLRFRQDTRDASAREAREYADALEPSITAREVAIKRRLLVHPFRDVLEESYGAQAFRLWAADARAYAPSLDELLVRESGLEAEYTRLIGGITVEFDGKQMTLAESRGYEHALDRNVRHAAANVRWDALAQRGAELDRIFDGLVAVRDQIGRALGHPSFVPVGYDRMHRVDYGAEEVARWRDEVVRDVVPLAAQIVEQSAKARGYERAMVWDETALVAGETSPIVDGATIVRELPAVLGTLDRRLGTFAELMRDDDHLDVFAREGKGPGAFCTSFPTEGYPFVFASFNGTKDDVKVLVHEMGHAFQNYSSQRLPLADYLVPTLESAEIDSMSLEFLAWPGLERYFGPRTAAFRADHLASALLFLPWGCAIDHFQHLVYAAPGASPDERRAMWLEMQRRYLPWRDFGDLAYPAAGNAWQYQLHVYGLPFYYIDYTLAQCCALQFWAQARRAQDDAVERYVRLCALGGSRSFRELVAAAGLESPFDGKALTGVVAEAKDYLSAAGLI